MRVRRQVYRATFARAYDVFNEDYPDSLPALSDLYDAALSVLDHEIAPLFDWLESRQRRRPVLLILFSDHGEHLGEHGMMNHLGSLYDVLLRIVFTARWEGELPAGSRVESQIQLIDVMPSLLRALNLKCPRPDTALYRDRPDIFDYDLLRAHDWPAYAEYEKPSIVERWRSEGKRSCFTPIERSLRAVRSRGYKYICGSDGSRELYSLRTDPDEEQNLLAAGACQDVDTIVEGMETLLSRLLPSGTPTERPESAPVDADVADQLRGLGYL
jgi:arylsulfatase A-like enzyme